MALDATVAELHKQLAKKSSFESAVAALTSLFRDGFASASPGEQKAMYSAACRAGTLLQTRYTGRGFWLAGLKLFEQAQDVLRNPQEQQQMKKYVSQARQVVEEDNARDEQRQGAVPPQLRAGSSSSFLFEGQLTSGPEPPPPAWLVAQNALATLAVSQHEGGNLLEAMNPLLEQLAEFPGLNEALMATFDNQVPPKTAPPASKDEVAKLAVVEVTEQILKNLGEGTECAVCREVFVVKDEMQEMPCKHYFHPPCLKPWLDEHNSCPICRHELPTDDHEYESRKEREREEEAERKGAANAVREGELMYI